MPRLLSIVEKTPVPDITIQSALREIDTLELSIAMLGFDEEEQEAVLRNMSKRAAKLLKEEIENERGKHPDFVIRDATESFEQKLSKYARHFIESDTSLEAYKARYLRNTGKGDEAKRFEHPDLDISSIESIFDSFRQLKVFIHAEGVLALEGIGDKTNHPVMKKALQLLIDGWDPDEMRVILNRAKKTYLEGERRKLDMILEGMDCLSTSVHPLGLAERLKAHMV